MRRKSEGDDGCRDYEYERTGGRKSISEQNVEAAHKAAYATVLFPVVALALSTVFEGYRWHWTGFLGLALTLAGNVVVFTGATLRAPSPSAPSSSPLVPRSR